MDFNEYGQVYTPLNKNKKKNEEFCAFCCGVCSPTMHPSSGIDRIPFGPTAPYWDSYWQKKYAADKEKRLAGVPPAEAYVHQYEYNKTENRNIVNYKYNRSEKGKARNLKVSQTEARKEYRREWMKKKRIAEKAIRVTNSTSK